MDKLNEATQFLASWRGRFIVSQALELAIQSIEARPQVQQEPSNVADMRYLRETIFGLPVMMPTGDVRPYVTVTGSGERLVYHPDTPTKEV